MSELSYKATHIREETLNTSCPYCGVGCGVTVNKTTTSRQNMSGTWDKSEECLSELRGTPKHPANSGKLCVKGSHLLDTNAEEGRLCSPSINGKQVEWDTAYDKVAKAMSECIEQYGPESVAFYLSGQLLTEDYYVANKLMKGYVGSANVDTNSRLCMSSAVAAYKRAFGSDTVPCCYDDLSNTDLIVLVGSNAAWTHPVLFQSMQAAKANNPDMKIILVDPRSTATASGCDLHLAIKPGTDAWLFNGLLRYISTSQAIDSDFVSSFTKGFDEALASADAADVQTVARICEVEQHALLQFYDSFVEAKRVISFYSMGINQSTSGVDKANSIINCHLASGKVGKVGSGPFSITGQPNAMGGREVGGLANMLAAHMDIDNPEHIDKVKRFWNAPNMVSKIGYKAVDMFDAIAQGDIKFIWIMGTNPVVSMPNRHLVEQALQTCPTVVVSDIVEKNDTLAFANISLPACGWSEKNGTVTNSERCITRQRALVQAIGDAKPDWEIVCEVAKRLGFEKAFSYQSAAEIFCEHAALSGFENDGQRDFDISGLANLSDDQYDALSPIQWPVNASSPNGTARMFTDNRYFTPSGKANFIAISPRAPQQLTSHDYPYVLNTGRMRDQWHTMTRTGKANKLHQHVEQANIYMHPDDAREHQLQDGDLSALHSSVSKNNEHAAVILPVKIDSKQRKGELFCPIHWSKIHGSHLNVAALFSSAADPISGQPELKHAAVSLSAVRPLMQMLVYTREALAPQVLASMSDYYVQTVQEQSFMYRLALLPSLLPDVLPEMLAERDGASGMSPLPLSNSKSANETSKSAWMSQVQKHIGADYEVISYDQDLASTQQRIFLRNQQLQGVIHLCGATPHVHKSWMDDVFSRDSLENSDIHRLLHYMPDPAFEHGRLICSCFKVHENTIVDAINAGVDSVSGLGEKLKCGTNCGSCKSELSDILQEHKGNVSALSKAQNADFKTIKKTSANVPAYVGDTPIQINVEM